MKNFKFYLVALLTLTVFLSSCSDDDDKPKGEFEKGVFVVNEGNFGSSDGTISHISASGEVTTDLFGSVNNGLILGDVVQSLYVENDLGYIVVNNDNKVEVVNANTFEASYTISDLKQPRYFITYNNKGYLTEWVKFGEPGRVSIVDLETHVVTGSITTDFGAENIIEENGKLYVSNTFASTVSVIDPVSATVVKTIEVENRPGEFVIDKQNKLWVICGGDYGENNGNLVQIDPATNGVIKTISLGIDTYGKIAINKAGTTLYYFKGKSVYSTSTTATTAGDVLFTESTAVDFYGIGIDPETDILYVADTKAYVGGGTVFTYTTSGTAISSYTSGRGPSGFVFE
jgi:YVTN family beta-propeller protein